jgi:nicotinamide-nucleotide amidase
MSSTNLIKQIEAAANILIDKKLTLAFAESATAGRAAAEFSMACHAGKFLKGGFICYDASLKSDVLKVDKTILEAYTPESMEVTEAIAVGLCSLIPADIHLGITGLPCAGGSETDEKPVGTMFIFAIFRGQRLFSDRTVFTGTHQEIIDQTLQHLATKLVEALHTDTILALP